MESWELWVFDDCVIHRIQGDICSIGQNNVQIITVAKFLAWINDWEFFQGEKQQVFPPSSCSVIIVCLAENDWKIDSCE